MCGISGGWNISRETVEKMCAHQSSRGPDNTGIKEIGKVIFGHNRLSIIDRSERGNQPMEWLNTSNLYGMITYNGEVYDQPRFRDGPQISNTDTETILRNCIIGIKNGENDHYSFDKILNSFNGMFAFGFYCNENIYLVRDQFGIKPLYFTHQKDFFAFASTPAAVSLTKTNWSRGEKGLHEYLSLGATMLHSMFDGIEAVPPGHYAVFNCKDQTFHMKRWYYPKFIENAHEKIEEKVRQAIDRVKLTCDEPQIILLSGGIDSTLVASRYEGQSAIHLSSPEQEYAQNVADKFQIQLNNVHAANYGAEHCLIDYITKSGDPTMAGIIPYITCGEIKKLGFRVAITANGADELFFGYDRMKDLSEQKQAIFRQFSFTESILMQYCMPKNAQKVEIDSYLTYDLNKTLDFASMCHSVEVRVPYLDHELVECALSIPQSQHVGKYGNKTILKKMLLELGFDFDFIHRPKMGFSLHSEPSDLQPLKKQAMAWYNAENLPKLGADATGRQTSYHEMTVLGLYFWSKIYGI